MPLLGKIELFRTRSEYIIDLSEYNFVYYFFSLESDDHYRTNTKQPATKAISLTANPSVRHACSINPKSSSLNLPPGHFRSPSPGRKDFVPGHRKVKSLGST